MNLDRIYPAKAQRREGISRSLTEFTLNFVEEFGMPTFVISTERKKSNSFTYDLARLAPCGSKSYSTAHTGLRSCEVLRLVTTWATR